MRLPASAYSSKTPGLGAQPIVSASLKDNTSTYLGALRAAAPKDQKQPEPEEMPEIKLGDSTSQHSKWILPRGRQQQSPRGTLQLVDDWLTGTHIVHKGDSEDVNSWILPREQHQQSPEGTLQLTDDWLQRTDRKLTVLSETSSSRSSSMDIVPGCINPAKPRRKPQRNNALTINIDFADNLPAGNRHILTPSQPTPSTSLLPGMLRPPRIERQLSESPIATYCTGYCRTQPILHDTNEPKAEVVRRCAVSLLHTN